jgi:hypothetical protein
MVQFLVRQSNSVIRAERASSVVFGRDEQLGGLANADWNHPLYASVR